jgi:peptide/nickel transport system substrate-binding protein
MDPTNQNAFGNAVVNVFDKMVAIAPDGKKIPGVASWQIIGDGKIIEFTLKQGVKFSNGDPLTTKDAEFSFNRKWELDPELKSEMAGFQKLEVVDDYTIRFYFEKPNVIFLTTSCPSMFVIASKAYYDRVGEEAFAKNPVGTGPYKVAAWELGQYIDLVPNEYYWGEKPQVDNAHIVVATDASTRIAMLRAGEVDLIMDTLLPNVADLEKAGFHKVISSEANGYALEFSTLNPNSPWADKRVRQAMAYAIDREALCKNLFFGIATVVPWLGKDELGYDPTLEPYNYNPDKAKQLLAEAGYPNGFDMPLYVGAFTSDMKNIAEYVASVLKAVNVNCKVEVQDIPTFIGMVQKVHKDTTMEYVSLGAPNIALTPEPSRTMSAYFLSTGIFATYSNPQVDTIITKALETVDDTQRGELIKQAMKIVSEDVPKIPLMYNPSVYMMKSNIDYIPTRGFVNSDFYIKNIAVK